MSNETQETLADIVREMRSRAEVAKSMPDHSTHNDGVGMMLDDFADRIEAAAQRERNHFADATKMVGNAAAPTSRAPMNPATSRAATPPAATLTACVTYK